MQAKRILVSILAVGLGLGLLMTLVVGLTQAQEPGPQGSAARVQAQGTVPATVSYQGRATVGGTPFNGMGYFKFAVVQSDNWVPWSNDGSAGFNAVPMTAVQLNVSNGLFSVLLGDTSVTGMTQPMPYYAFADPVTVLRVWFSPDGSTFTQLPDRPISSVPYALYAEDAASLSGMTFSEFAWADHNHWGQAWSGSGTGLTLNSSGSAPALNISSGDNDGIYVPSAGGDGVEVHAAGQDGFYVGTAGDDGMQIGFQSLWGDYYGSADDGIVIYDAGNAPSHALPNEVWTEDTHDGIDIAGAADMGLWVGYAGSMGVNVHSAGDHGVVVGSAGDDGVFVGSVGGNGVNIGQTTHGDGVLVNSAGNDGVGVFYAGNDGLWVEYAGDDGVQIGSESQGSYSGASDDGIAIYDAGNASTHALPTDVGYDETNDGIDIAGARDFGLWVGYAGHDGLHVFSAGGTGLMVWSADDDGVVVWSAGNKGIHVGSANYDGVFANTSRVDNMWGVYTPDKIQAMNLTMRSLSIIARNDGPVPLQAGDLVAVTSADRPLLGGGPPMPNVRRADGRFTGVIGVVESRMELTVVDPTEEWAEQGEAPPGVKPEDVIYEEVRSVSGDAAPGEYLSIIVYGITDVKVDATAGPIEPGQRVTAADLAGHARGLQTRLLEGMIVTEGAPVIGIALEPLEKGTGTITVFVTLQ